MSYTLLGSLTSPFVRRVRLLMENIPYELKELNIYETDDGLELNKINPVNQIPVLLDRETKIWDSRQIFNYLNQKHKFHPMNWEQENTLTAIDGAMSSAVNLFLMKRSGMNITEPYMFINRQKERVDSVLTYLRPYMKDNGLKEWNFISMSLYCFLDWGTFRGIIDTGEREECHGFLAAHCDKKVVKETEIPRI